MATIAIVTSDVVSKRLLAHRFADRCVAAGHEVVLLGRAPELEGSPHPTRHLDLHVDGAPGFRRRPIRQWRATREAAATVDGAPLLDLLDEVGATLTVVDIEEHETLFVALAADRNVAVLDPFFRMWPGDGVPPLDSPRLPAADPLGRIAVGAAWARSRLRMTWRDLRYHLAGRKIERSTVVRLLARRYGVRNRMTARAWLHPFAPADTPVLSLVAPALDLPGTLPGHVRSLGPLLPPAGDLAKGPLRDFVERGRSRRRPLVVAAFGGFVADDPASLASRVVDAAALRPELDFVLAAQPDPTTARPDNVFVTEWIPQRPLLTGADAAIVHSGTGTLHECVAARVPMLVYPFPVNDQAGNAVRVTHHGVGLLGDRDTDTASQIAARLDRLLDDGDTRRRLASIAEAMEAADSPDPVANVLVELVDR